MKKIDLYSLMGGLKKTNFVHPRSTYAVNKNKRQIKEIIEEMELSIKPSEKMSEFMKDREELAKTHSAKDEKGKPKMIEVKGVDPEAKQMVYDIIGQDDPKSDYEKAFAKLKKKFEEEIKVQEDKVEKYNEELRDKETEYNVFMIELSFLQEHEKCPLDVMDLIWWMVKDDISKIDKSK